MALDLRCVRVQHFRMTELLIAKFRRIDVLKYEMTKKKRERTNCPTVAETDQSSGDSSGSHERYRYPSCYTLINSVTIVFLVLFGRKFSQSCALNVTCNQNGSFVELLDGINRSSFQRKRLSFKTYRPSMRL